MLAALIYVFTAYVHVPSFKGYTHVGDGFLYLAACLLPTPYAAAAGAIGAGLADVLSGYAIWAPGTVIIKAVTALFFTSKSAKIVTVRNLLALVPALVICAGGYYLYEALVIDDFVVALAGVPGYFIQVTLSSVVYVLLGKAFDRAALKEKFAIMGGVKE
jgi:uncharacterized repeat protein (TIGR04002 family)